MTGQLLVSTKIESKNMLKFSIFSKQFSWCNTKSYCKNYFLQNNESFIEIGRLKQTSYKIRIIASCKKLSQKYYRYCSLYASSILGLLKLNVS